MTQPAAGSFQSSVSMRSDVEGGDFPRADRLFFVGWTHTYDATIARVGDSYVDICPLYNLNTRGHQSTTWGPHSSSTASLFELQCSNTDSFPHIEWARYFWFSFSRMLYCMCCQRLSNTIHPLSESCLQDLEPLSLPLAHRW